MRIVICFIIAQFLLIPGLMAASESKGAVFADEVAPLKIDLSAAKDLRDEVLSNYIRLHQEILEDGKSTHLEISGADFAMIANLLPFMRNVVSLKFTLSHIGNAGVSMIAALPNFETLRILDIGEDYRSGANDNIDDKSIEWIANSSTLVALEELNLHGSSEVTDKGAQALAVASGLRSLKALNLVHTQITPTGFMAMARSKSLPSLKTLFVSQRDIYPDPFTDEENAEIAADQNKWAEIMERKRKSGTLGPEILTDDVRAAFKKRGVEVVEVELVG